MFNIKCVLSFSAKFKRFFWSCSFSTWQNGSLSYSYTVAMKPFDSGMNANLYCRCGLTNSKYYVDANILVVWIHTNVVAVFSTVTVLLHSQDMKLWSINTLHLFHMNYFRPGSVALYFNSDLTHCMCTLVVSNAY